MLAPSERVVVDVLFSEPGEVALEHRTLRSPTGLLRSRSFTSRPSPTSVNSSKTCGNETTGRYANGSRPFIESPPDKTLSFVAEMDEVGPEGGVDTGVYACPMHPEIVASWAGKCPKCGMKLMPMIRGRDSDRLRLSHACRDHGHVGGALRSAG